jgi:hypothetical protein
MYTHSMRKTKKDRRNFWGVDVADEVTIERKQLHKARINNLKSSLNAEALKLGKGGGTVGLRGGEVCMTDIWILNETWAEDRIQI